MTPLGNSGLSWSDVLLGELPNVYVYAANTPSESIVAKHRGYGHHRVPTTCRRTLSRSPSHSGQASFVYSTSRYGADASAGATPR